MKKTRITFLVLLLFAAACAEKKQEPIDNQINTEEMEKQDKVQLEALLAAYKEVLNTSDAAQAVKLYTKDGVFMPTEAPTANGPAGIKGAYEFVFSQIQLKVEFFIEEIVVEGNMAFAVTSSKGTVLIRATGDSVPEENRELFVFEKENGAWKIARYMFNKAQPKQ